MKNSIKKILEDFGVTKYVILEDNSVIINQNIDWSNRELKELPFIISEMNGNLDLSNNHFNILKNFPRKINGTIDLSHNKIFELNGFPIEVTKDVLLNNNNLISIKGISKNIGGSYLNISNNKLMSLEFLPKNFDGVLLVENNYLSDLTVILPINKIIFDGNPIEKVNLDKHYRKLLTETPELLSKYKKIISPELLEEFKWFSDGEDIGFFNLKLK